MGFFCLGKGLTTLYSRLSCLSVSLHFPIGILGQVWYLIVTIPDLCTLTYFVVKQNPYSPNKQRIYYVLLKMKIIIMIVKKIF